MAWRKSKKKNVFEIVFNRSLISFRIVRFLQNIMSIKITTQTKGKLKDFNEAAIKASEAVAREFPRRIKPKVKKAVQSAYKGVRAVKINEAVSHTESSGMFGSITYRAGVSSLKEFNLTPKSRPAKRPYTMSVTIKGGRVAFGGRGTPYFVDPNGHAYKRLDAKRTPGRNTKIERLNTLSVVAMIQNDAKPEIEKETEDLLDKRMQHYLDRFLSS